MKKNIVYLDDHVLFQQAVIDAVDPALERFHFVLFQQADDCLAYLQQSMETDNRIDVIITDFNHPGKNGLDFSLAVRKMEASLSCKHSVPIIFLSMVDPFAHIELTEPEINEWLKENPDTDRSSFENAQKVKAALRDAANNNLFSAVLTKAADLATIVQAIEKAVINSNEIV